MASGSGDGTVQVWSMETNSKVWQFQHDQKVNCVQLQNKQVISCSDDGSTRIWNLDTGIEIHRLAHESECNNFDLNSDQTLLAVASNGAVVLWDFKTATKIKEFKLGETSPNDLRFNPAGDRLIVGLYDGRIFKIDLAYNTGDKNEKAD